MEILEMIFGLFWWRIEAMFLSIWIKGKRKPESVRYLQMMKILLNHMILEINMLLLLQSSLEEGKTNTLRKYLDLNVLRDSLVKHYDMLIISESQNMRQ